jgi:competence protein ComEA
MDNIFSAGGLTCRSLNGLFQLDLKIHGVNMKLSIIIAATLLIFSGNLLATPVNINAASASEIAAALTGIGQSKAEAIVAYRSQNGDFKKANDIVQVRGIGNAIYEKNKNDILLK